MARRRKTRKSTFSKETQKRIVRAFGLLMMLIATLLFFACLSYLYTWKHDQSLAFKPFRVLFSNVEMDAQNGLGILGAKISHLLFYHLVGISVFIPIILLFIIGLNYAIEKSSFPMKILMKYSLVAIIILPVFFDFILGYKPFAFGGGYGQVCNDYLQQLLGFVGTGITLLFVLLILMVLNFNFSFDKLLPNIELKPISFPKIKFPNWNWIEEERTVKQKSPTATQTNEEKEQFEFKIEDKSGHKKQRNVKLDEDLILDISSSPGLEERQQSQKKMSSESKKDEVLSGPAYNPKLDLADYVMPHTDLLETYSDYKVSMDKRELEANKNRIIDTLGNYNIHISSIKATVGPTITLYEIVPAPGVKISRIRNLGDDIALSLAALGIRIIAPIPGKGTIGIEVPNQKRQIVSLRSLLESPEFETSTMDLPIAIGTNISKGKFIADLTKMPHLLMAGATGQGKSVGINVVIASLLYKKHPSELKFVMIDPKKVELSIYSRIEKHYLAKIPGEDDVIITETRKSIHTLNALCIEMDNRYNLLKKANVRNLKEYNKKFINRRLNPENGHCFLPYIVLVIDEFADLIMTAGKEIETPLTRLAQLARAIGIHLLIATQRPTVNIITGTIKANFPARIAFRTTSKVDSKTIIDQAGADQLVGRGDMLLSLNGELIRLQCAFVDTPEVENIVQYIGHQKGYPELFFLPEYVDEKEQSRLSGAKSMADFDTLFTEAALLVVRSQSGSTSMIQRKLSLGYNRAGRIMDQMEEIGIVGPNIGSKPRDVQILDELELQNLLDSFSN